jgi:hypothetical protein
MLKVEDLKVYDITTPLAKKDAGINSTSKDAYTWIPGKSFDPVSAFVSQGQSGVMLWAPTSGATTSSVHRTRCEVKGDPFYFKDQPVHTSEMTIIIHKVNWLGSVVIMQMHCHDGNDPTNKTFLEVVDGKGRLRNGMRLTKSTSDPKKTLLLDNIDLSLPFSIKYCTTQDGFFTVDAGQGENKGHLEGQFDSVRASRPHVYHWGAYNQIDEGDAREPVGDGTLVELIHLAEYHGEVPVTIPPVELTPYEAAQKRVDELEVEYYKALKKLQTSIKTELNILTTDMKLLEDKELLAPIYIQIKEFKLDMDEGCAII